MAPLIVGALKEARLERLLGAGQVVEIGGQQHLVERVLVVARAKKGHVRL